MKQKRIVFSVILAIVIFIAVYLFMSLAIPGFRVKLEAAPDVVFLENLKIIWRSSAACRWYSESGNKKKHPPAHTRRGMFSSYFFFLSTGLPSMPTGPLPLMAR